VSGIARIVVVLFVAVVATLAVLSISPQERANSVTDEISLQSATVMLYPASDPEAVWTFTSPNVRYDPSEGRTTLLDLQDGERRVADTVDFTLQSDELIIDRSDDVRSPAMNVHLVEDDLDVEMLAAEQRYVLSITAQGVFEVPRIRIYGEDFGESRYEEMRVSFDFTQFEAGGPDTIGYSEFELSERDEPAPGGTP